MRHVRWLCLAGCLSWSAPLFAHAPPQATGIEWPEQAGAASLIVRTNRGLLVKNGTSPTRLLCNDAYRANLSETVPFHATGAGLLVSSYAAGLLRASADLCEFSPVPVPFADQTLIDLGAHGEQILYALTLPSDSAPGQIFKTDDAGAHFTPGATSTTFGTSLGIAPSNPDTLYAAQLDLSNPSAGLAQIAVSHDAGQTFTTHAIALEGMEFRAFVLGVDPNDERRVFVRTEPGDSTFPERLLLSEDGGATFAPVWSGVGPLSLAIDESSDVVWLGAHDGLFRSQDGGRQFRPVDSTQLSLIDCLAVHQGALYACAFGGEFAVYVSNDDARSFQPYVRFPDVTEPVSCPGETQVASACVAAFEDWREEQNPDSVPSTSDETGQTSHDSSPASPTASNGGCQVSFGSASSALPLTVRLLVLALIRASRRRRAAQTGYANPSN